ncbi:hypothetical protein E2562_032126 [Oryza meyeriana var. granulata]|uniref:Uncharacterized protein n=1 Tax=Oryza meyeriana var. granulata TaxID=110450 RepID=A0A6G1CKD0_9ORYZ|nr:hypothetical protein E2562_032126 [Oryza meyeriana var. granulata]
MAAAAAAPLANNARAGGDNALAGDHDPVGRRLERRLHLYAAVYMLLGASFLLRRVVSHTGAASPVVVGSLLWAAAVAMAVLSLQTRRFPLAVRAADRLAQAALRAFF